MNRLALYDLFDGAFASGRCDPNTLIVEVTESHSIDHPERVAAPLEALAAAGVTISVDDFGTGHSSFARVESLHARELKLDRSLVQADDRVREAKSEGGLRELIELDLVEVSLVAHPMQPKARVHAVEKMT